ncbi:MAG: hypothetical protein ACD_56C00036G0001 [uncultured bacterium]|nr:MAG: hypothetical protein ACD_56C00036G0001 [uncultured bacterium]
MPKQEKDLSESRKVSDQGLMRQGAEYVIDEGADKPRLEVEKFQIENQQLIMQLEKGDKTLSLESALEGKRRKDEFPEYVQLELRESGKKIYAAPGQVKNDEKGFYAGNIFMLTALEGGNVVLWDTLSLEDKKAVIDKLYE